MYNSLWLRLKVFSIETPRLLLRVGEYESFTLLAPGNPRALTRTFLHVPGPQCLSKCTVPDGVVLLLLNILFHKALPILLNLSEQKVFGVF